LLQRDCRRVPDLLFFSKRDSYLEQNRQAIPPANPVRVARFFPVPGILHVSWLHPAKPENTGPGDFFDELQDGKKEDPEHDEPGNDPGTRAETDCPEQGICQDIGNKK
jgi:hypothetical protein